MRVLGRPAAAATRPAWVGNAARGSVALAMIFAGVSGCGLSLDDRTVAIPEAELPAELNQPTTTTTTTTTVAPSTPPTTTGSSVAVTTPADGALIGVDVYYPRIGSEEEMYLSHTYINPPGDLDELIEVLTTPDASARSDRLRSVVDDDLIVDYSLERGTLSLNLDRETYNQLAGFEKRQAVAQMVLSFTSYAPPGEGGIGQVAFAVDDDPISVIIPNKGSSDRGEGVTFDDFESLIRDIDDLRGSSTTTAYTAPPASATGAEAAGAEVAGTGTTVAAGQ